MKINNFNNTLTSASLNESLKTKFGYSLDIANMNLPKARATFNAMNETLVAFEQKAGSKAATTDVYVEKKLVLETLKTFIAEKESALKVERRASRLKSKLNENQAAEAEVVLAAKDMVDRVQGMIEDIGEMQNEQLQPLVDSIRTTLGEESASSFETGMDQALASAMEAMRSARSDADAASRVLSGDEPVDNFMGDEAGDLDLGGEEDLGGDLELGDEPAQDDAGLGREARPETDDADLDLSGL